MYNYVQIVGGNESWQPVPTDKLQEFVKANQPRYTTVLSVSALVDETLSKEDLSKLTYSGPLYFDWDGTDIDEVLPQARKLIEKLVELGVDPETLHLYATGGKGFHCEIPQATYLDKIPKAGTVNLPLIFKEIALDLFVDTLDLRVYTGKRGRMWRSPNVQRENERYKVPITYAELQEMDASIYKFLTSTPRAEPARKAPVYCLNLAMLFVKMQQKVTGALAKRKKTRAAPTLRTDMPSLEALCQGRGIRPGTGFHQIALQLGTIAAQLGWSEEDLVSKCEGLIATHESDGNRYNSPSKRRNELVRMHRVTDDNPCYEVAIGAIKSILSHAAPDIDGIPVPREDIEEGITEAEVAPSDSYDEDAPDEFGDLAGVTLNRYGVYANVEGGTKRICAVSFSNVEVLKSLEAGTISAIETDIMVNGKRMTRQGLELDVFASVQGFNRFCARFGHAFQGNDANIRGLYMRVIESAKKSGKEFYVTSREGLDIINIPSHENPIFREPFMVWADGKGIVLEPRVAEGGLNLRFQGYPDTRGAFKMDLSDAPNLIEWCKDPDKKEQLAQTVDAMFNCQRPEAISKMVGWTVACFYRMPFHKAYGKFPLLHVNAPAGTGKSEMTKALLGFFYYNQEPKVLSPSSTLFALSYAAAGSTTPPLMVDEYKPHAMLDAVKEKMKLMFRDAYNAREQQRGGGNRDSDDYRSIHAVTLTAPIAFIGEAVEEESAVMERVVLVTLARPYPVQAAKDYAKFQVWQRSANLLSIFGQYIASQTVKRYSIDQLREDFDAMYAEARAKFMLTAEDLDNKELDLETLNAKQSTKERTVFNYTVAAYGLRRFGNLLEGLWPGRFTSKLQELEDNIFTRMEDVATTTQPEWMKVFNSFADMSYAEESVYKLEKGRDYALVPYQGRDCLELYVRVAYNKYRMWAKATGIKPLYSGETAFIHALKDCQARIPSSGSLTLQVPGGSHVFDLDALMRAGFRGVKDKR